MGSLLRRGKPLLIMALALVAVMSACSAPPATGGGSAPQSSGQVASSAAPKRITAVVMSDPPQLATVLNPNGGAGSSPGLDSIEMLLNAGLSVFDYQGSL